MALTKSLSVEIHGKTLAFENAYFQVSNITGTKVKQTALVTVYSDSSKAHVLQDSSFSFSPDMNGGNFVKQAYDAAKLLPDYQGAKDC